MCALVASGSSVFFCLASSISAPCTAATAASPSITPMRPVGHPALDEPALVGDDAHLNTLNARVAANHLGGEVALEFVKLALVDDRLEDGVHVVRHAMVVWE